ncbi:MAG: DUF2889 domain-containing protein [Negativicutes bacterium]|nr:DUF2889 domain-containing protein [Negativicutes bacterium]
MKTLWNSQVYTTVSRLGDGELLSKTILLSTGYEVVTHIAAATDSFVISDAGWEIYRSPESRFNGGNRVDALIGRTAYFGLGPILRGVGAADGELPRELLGECVKGIIQAETYLYQERGYSSTKEYETFWRSTYRDICRLYSNFERSSQTWYQHIANRKWGDSLFTRCKTAVIQEQADRTLLITASFSDSFHELGLNLIINHGVITAADGTYFRAPDAVCFENTTHLTALIGRPAAELTRKAVGECTGGPQGCNHLVDLVGHAIKTWQEAQTKLG